jgi:hypothetical protein
MFLAGAVAAGLAAGRLTRGMTDAARSGGQRPDPQRPDPQRLSREIPPGAAIPPPPDPHWTTPMTGYPADAVPGAGPGEEIPPASFQDRGRYQDSGYQDSGFPDGGFPDGGFPDSTPETYRPGQQP